MRLLLAVLAASALALAGCGHPAPEPPPVRSVLAGELAPDFSFTTGDGTRIRAADLKGQPVALVFWASWCEYCVAEAPTLEKLHRQYGPRGLRMFGIGINGYSDVLRDKAKELKLAYPVGLGREVADRYGTHSVPTTYLINRQGRVAAVVHGAYHEKALRGGMEAVLR